MTGERYLRFNSPCGLLGPSIVLDCIEPKKEFSVVDC